MLTLDLKKIDVNEVTLTSGLEKLMLTLIVGSSGLGIIKKGGLN